MLVASSRPCPCSVITPGGWWTSKGQGESKARATRELDLGVRETRTHGAYQSYEHMVRALILRDQGDPSAAAEELRAALTTDPDDFLLRSLYAQVLTDLGQHERARRHISRAILLEPTAQVAWVSLAQLYRVEGKAEKAIEAARQGVRVEPDQPEAALWLASFLREGGRGEVAGQLYRRVLHSDPTNLQALKGLAEIDSQEGRHLEARNHFARYLEAGGTDMDAVVVLAREYVASGDTARGTGLLEASVAADSGDAHLRAELIDLLSREGLHGRALHHLRSLPSVAPGDFDDVARRVDWLRAAVRPYEARSVLVSVVGSTPESPEARLVLASLEMSLRRYDVARVLLEAPDVEWPAKLHEQLDRMKSELAGSAE